MIVSYAIDQERAILMDDPNEIASAFKRDGYAVLKNVLVPEEIVALKRVTSEIIEHGGTLEEAVRNFSDLRSRAEINSDFFYQGLHAPELNVFNRVNYVLSYVREHPNPILAVLAHPKILRATEAIVGDDQFPTVEALVFKLPGNGAAVWPHTDCDPEDETWSDDHRSCTIDIYLDDSSVENGCLLAAPESHKVRQNVQQVRAIGFDFPGLTPIPVKAGDVILHDPRVVHGSRTNTANQIRRTLYFEFQPLSQIIKEGVRPGAQVTHQWIEDRMHLMLAATKEREKFRYLQNEDQHPFTPPRGYQTLERATGTPPNLRPAIGANKYI